MVLGLRGWAIYGWIITPVDLADGEQDWDIRYIVIL